LGVETRVFLDAEAADRGDPDGTVQPPRRNTVPRIFATAAALVAALAVAAAPASAAKGVKYKGKTSSGHKITFTFKKKRLYNLQAGIRVSCISIQGRAAPLGGVDAFSYKGYAAMNPKGEDFTFKKKPAFSWNEATTKHTLTSKLNRRTRKISGKMRMQYSFLIPKYPIGTFTIYSCLGGAKFSAKPVKKK